MELEPGTRCGPGKYCAKANTNSFEQDLFTPTFSRGLTGFQMFIYILCFCFVDTCSLTYLEPIGSCPYFQCFNVPLEPISKMCLSHISKRHCRFENETKTSRSSRNKKKTVITIKNKREMMNEVKDRSKETTQNVVDKRGVK